ncbi:hypothetical protein EDC96DRAFT_517657 [Choanephora cucurbitarum]|nr:hypothetical protein EDC96DRAFT_517657 [Choanephora cucurbitarum]
MPSEKFRIATNGQSLRNPNNAFFGMTLTANLTVDENDVSAHNDRRSAHNALERQRREHLNIKFQQLAHALPALQSVRRPSKTMIVAKSLEFVSASLKRESNFTAEIERLRAENEKLRSQAQAQSQLLTQQEDETPKKEVKRKASEMDQLSPPPTPEAMRSNSHQKSPVILPQDNKKKKRMVKQTKPSQQTPTEPTMVTPMTESPWSPVDDHFRQPASYAVTNQNSPSYTSPYTTHLNSPNHDLLFMPTPSQYDPLPTRPQEYQTMMNSMLFAPYCLSSEPSNQCKFLLADFMFSR